jgi:hypothetical protein
MFSTSSAIFTGRPSRIEWFAATPVRIDHAPERWSAARRYLSAGGLL